MSRRGRSTFFSMCLLEMWHNDEWGKTWEHELWEQQRTSKTMFSVQSTSAARRKLLFSEYSTPAAFVCLLQLHLLTLFECHSLQLSIFRFHAAAVLVSKSFMYNENPIFSASRYIVYSFCFYSTDYTDTLTHTFDEFSHSHTFRTSWSLYNFCV